MEMKMYCIVTGLEFASTEEMMEAYGVDTPEQLRAEAEYIAQFEDYGPHLPRARDYDEIPF